MLPIWLLEKEDPLYSAAMSSCVVNNRMLATLTMADACGRTCAKEAIEKAKERIELFAMFCDENGCYTQPKQFQTERARFRYFFERKGHPDYDYFEPTNGEVIVMCGLQASGKDHVIKKHYADWITVGLDQTRLDMDLDYGDDEPAVVQEAREKCKQLMREKKSFVFNATNIVKDIRMRWINLFRQYKYRVTIYYKERPLDVMLKANKERENPVPNDVILEKVKKIDIPTIMECHELITDVSYI
jgi:predicted kinase